MKEINSEMTCLCQRDFAKGKINEKTYGEKLQKVFKISPKTSKKSQKPPKKSQKKKQAVKIGIVHSWFIP